MFVPYTHESIRLTGRWDKAADRATATTTGAYIEFAFEGNMAVARFDIDANMLPYLHLWIQIDGGDMVETAIDRYLRICTKKSGHHICRIIYKGGLEVASRWYHPLQGKVTFLGVQTEKPAELPADNRRVIEFVGDSITEGVLIDVDFYEDARAPFYLEPLFRSYQDDACATYAWLTAERLNLRPVIMGYGAGGTTKAGMANVPPAAEAYPFNFENSPITHAPSDFVVINHGTNDRRATAELCVEKYAELLDVVIRHNPNAKIVVLTPFCGAFKDELREMVKEYNRKNGTNVYYINGGEWIAPTPIHPLRDGHQAVADHLVPLLKEIFEL